MAVRGLSFHVSSRATAFEAFRRAIQQGMPLMSAHVGALSFRSGSVLMWVAASALVPLRPPASAVSEQISARGCMQPDVHSCMLAAGCRAPVSLLTLGLHQTILRSGMWTCCSPAFTTTASWV